MKPGRLFRFKVRSLNHTIILLFAIIIAPIASVLVYQAVNDARHASSVKFEVQSTVLARRARDNYRVFANGVAEVVDTGSLSARARQALKNTQESLLGHLRPQLGIVRIGRFADTTHFRHRAFRREKLPRVGPQNLLRFT